MDERSVTNRIYTSYKRCAKLAYNIDTLDGKYSENADDEAFKNFVFIVLLEKYTTGDSNTISRNVKFSNRFGDYGIADFVMETSRSVIDKDEHVEVIKELCIFKLKRSFDTYTIDDLDELAYIGNLAKESGHNVKEYFIISINKSFISPGYLNSDFLRIENSKTRIKNRGLSVQSELLKIRKEIGAINEPERNIGGYCLFPSECPMVEKCFTSSRYSHSSIYVRSLNRSQKLNLAYNGITDIKDIPRDEKFTEAQLNEIKALIKGNNFPDKERLKEFLKKLGQNIWFVNFDSRIETVPQFKGLSPMSRIPYLFRCYLYKNRTDLATFSKIIDEPFELQNQKVLIDEFLKTISMEKVANIVTFNKHKLLDVFNFYEILFPELSSDIKKLTTKIVDLKDVLDQGLYVNYELKGSRDLIKLAPIIRGTTFPKELNYENKYKAKLDYFRLKTNYNNSKKLLQDINEYYCYTIAEFTLYLRKQVGIK